MEGAAKELIGLVCTMLSTNLETWASSEQTPVSHSTVLNRAWGSATLAWPGSKWLLHVFQQGWFTDVLLTFICCGTVSAPQGSSLNMSIFLSAVDEWWSGGFGQQRWVWAVTGAGLFGWKSKAPGELSSVELSGKTVRSSRTNSVPRAQNWARSMIRLGNGQLGQMGVSLIAPQFVTAQKGQQHWTAPPVTLWMTVIHITLSLCSHAPWSSSCSLLGGCINHLFVVRLMNLLPEILTMIWENQWNKERLLAHYLGRSLLTQGVIFLLPMVWLEAVNVMQHCAAWNEWCGTCQVLFQGLVSVSETLPLQWTYGKEWKRMGKEFLYRFMCGWCFSRFSVF